MIEIGRLLRGSAAGCVIGCWVSQVTTPQYGGLVRIPVAENYQVYGIIYDIQVEDDGLVRQLLSADVLDDAVITDNRLNRNVPVEISVLFAGYQEDGMIFHLLPPRPPLTLDAMFQCTDHEICTFSSAGNFGYFRHILRASDLPVGELLSSHLRLVDAAQRHQHNPIWIQKAVQELIILLRDDYGLLMSVLAALSDSHLILGEYRG